MPTKNFNIRLRTKGDKKAKKALGGVTSSIKSMVGTLGSVYALKKGFDATIKAAAEQEKIFKDLQTAVENTGKKWGDAKGELDSMFASLQATTKYGDTDSAQMFQSLIEYTGDYETATENMGLLLDMASTEMFNQQSAARYLGQALAGNTSTLGRYIPELKSSNNEQLKHMDSAEKAAYAQKVLNEKFGGTAQKNLENVADQYDQMKNYLGDIGEAIGDKVLPGMNDLLGSTVDWLQQINESDMETAVRQLQEMGAAADKLTELNKMIQFNNALKQSEESAENLADYFEHEVANYIGDSADAFLDMENYLEAFEGNIEASQVNLDSVREMANNIKNEMIELAKIEDRDRPEQWRYDRYKKNYGILQNIVKLVEQNRQAQENLNREEEKREDFYQNTNVALEQTAYDFIPEINTQTKDWSNATGETHKWVSAIADEAKTLSPAAQNFSDRLNPIKTKTKNIKENVYDWSGAMQSIANQMASTWGQAITEMVDNSKTGFDEIWISFRNMLERMVIEFTAKAAVFGILNAISWGGFGAISHGAHMATQGGLLSFIFGSHGGVVDKDQIQYYETGGLSRGSDTVPAMLTPGEMVLNTDQQKELFNLAKGEGETSNNVTVNIQGDFLGSEQQADKLANVIEKRSKRGFNKIAVT